MNRFARGMLTGGLLGLAAVGTMMMIGRRQQRRMMRMANSRRLRHRARRTINAVGKNAMRFGSAVRSGTAAFASRLAEKDSWGRT
ncbi:MAG: hypothetical protein ACM3ZC_03380 [Bacteroidota bacterium]